MHCKIVWPRLRHLASIFTFASLSILACSSYAGTDASAAETKPSAEASTSAQSAAPAANHLRVHYKRSGGDQALWGVYAWEGPQVPSKKWIGDRFMFSGKDAYGGYVDIPMAAGKIEIRFLVTNDQGYKNCNTDQNHPLKADIGQKGQEIWVLQASCAILDQAPK